MKHVKLIGIIATLTALIVQTPFGASNVQAQNKSSEQTAKTTAYTLLVRDAKLTGDLELQNKEKGTFAAIHNWNSTKQKISWNTNIKKGRYQIRIKYAEPLSGSAITITIGNQQLATLLKQTAGKDKYQEFDLGVINVASSGNTEILLQGIQLSLIKNKEGKMEHSQSLPNLQWVSLTPTDKTVDSTPADILKSFKGKPLFDGKTFNGWTGNNGKSSMEWFRIENGAIVAGRMDKPIPRNEFVRTIRKYKNYELRLKYKVKHTDETYNAGVQFRTRQQTEKGKTNEMVGYQADIVAGILGKVYDEQRRWLYIGNQLDTPANYNADEWNSYIIRCEGPRIRVWLNDVKTLDYIEPYYNKPYPVIGAIAHDGFIALQIHEGIPCETWYKDIEIQELP